MSWKLFLDDLRFPVDDDFVIARNFDEAITLVETLGCPIFISFDHDLGDNIPTGFDFAKWLVECDLDKDGLFLSKDFDFYVHSANPVGKENIEGLLNGYGKFKGSEIKKNKIGM